MTESKRCQDCGGRVVMQDMNGVTFCWPDETPFDPQPQEGHCVECKRDFLYGLTPEQKLRLAGGRGQFGRMTEVE